MLWVVGRIPAKDGETITFQFKKEGTDIAMERVSVKETAAQKLALKALFSTQKITDLEYLIHARYSSEQLREQLAMRGYGGELLPAARVQVYSENRFRTALKGLKSMLVEESLRSSIVCCETVFIAVREQNDKKVDATSMVANAWPAGWSGDFLSSSMRAGGGVDLRRALNFASGVQRKASVESRPSRARPSPQPPLYKESESTTVFSGVPTFINGKAVLFDSSVDDVDTLLDRTTLRQISVELETSSLQSVDPGLKILIYVGALDMPRATIRLVDFLWEGGAHPLNLWRDADQILRIVLRDPKGIWVSEAPTLSVDLTG